MICLAYCRRTRVPQPVSQNQFGAEGPTRVILNMREAEEMVSCPDQPAQKILTDPSHILQIHLHGDDTEAKHNLKHCWWRLCGDFMLFLSLPVTGCVMLTCYITQHLIKFSSYYCCCICFHTETISMLQLRSNSFLVFWSWNSFPVFTCSSRWFALLSP